MNARRTPKLSLVMTVSLFVLIAACGSDRRPVGGGGGGGGNGGNVQGAQDAGQAQGQAQLDAGAQACEGSWSLGESVYATRDTATAGAACSPHNAPQNCPTGDFIMFRSTGECICIVNCGALSKRVGDSCGGDWQCQAIESPVTSNRGNYCVPQAWNLCQAAPTPTPTPTPSPSTPPEPQCAGDGQACTNSEDCCSEFCGAGDVCS